MSMQWYRFTALVGVPQDKQAEFSERDIAMSLLKAFPNGSVLDSPGLAAVDLELNVVSDPQTFAPSPITAILLEGGSDEGARHEDH